MMKALEGLRPARSVEKLGRVFWGLLQRPSDVAAQLDGCVRDAMTAPAISCLPQDPLSQAARIMWDGDCGFVVVVDDAGQLAGVVTDRDLCMASFTQGRALSEIATSSVLSGSVRACQPDDSLARAIELMRSHRVRRLVVRSGAGEVLGVLSLADVARRVGGLPPEATGPRLLVASLVTELARPWAREPASPQAAG